MCAVRSSILCWSVFWKQTTPFLTCDLAWGKWLGYLKYHRTMRFSIGDEAASSSAVPIAQEKFMFRGFLFSDTHSIVTYMFEIATTSVES
jgi:hypothetical protein